MAPKSEATKETEQAVVAAAAAAAADTPDKEGATGGDDNKEVAASGEPEESKEPEEPKELEQDAANDSRSKVAAKDVAMNMFDATMNVMPTWGGKMLMTLNEGGFQYLLASVRARVGVKAGRYMFEVRIVECLNPAEPTEGGPSRSPSPKNLVRVGVSPAGSSIFLGDTTDSVCFDSEGYFAHGRKRTRTGQKFGRDVVVAVLLNLDESSPNANTISIFRDGVRASEPQPIPENMRGKTLYPVVTYRNVSLQVNFGPVPLHKLPFNCRMLEDAAAADVEVADAPAPKDGKYEVLFPVGLPDKGVFDWADDFLEKNPDYTEISSRKILEWAGKSGLWRPKSQVARGSIDSPDFGFGLPLMDDMSARRVLASVAPVLQRNFLVTELQQNLVPADRKQMLERFNAPHFKKVAAVLMGEPSTDYKAKVQQLLLAEKVAQAEIEKKAKAAEEERKRIFEEKKRKAEEAKRARIAAQKKKEGKEDMEEEKADEAKETESADVNGEKKGDDMEVEKPVELTDEEKKSWYRKLPVPDMNETAIAKSYASFALPQVEEGFDEVRYVWQQADQCAPLLREYILERKKSQRVEDLQMSEWFKEHWGTWQKTLAEWRKRQVEWKDPVRRKLLLQKKKEQKAKEAAEDAAQNEEEEGEQMEINADDIEPLTVEDVTDIGSGEPLFAEFAYEDWALLSLRVELHLMVHAFRMTLDDPDRPSVHESHVTFYYTKYFKKNLLTKNYGLAKFKDLVDLVKDTITIKEDGMLQTLLQEDEKHSSFVKFAEEHRRDRQRRVDAGDETALLKFPRAVPHQPSKPPALGAGAARPVGPVFGAQKRFAPAAAYTPVPKQARVGTAFAPGPAFGGAYPSGVLPYGFQGRR